MLKRIAAKQLQLNNEESKQPLLIQPKTELVKTVVKDR